MVSMIETYEDNKIRAKAIDDDSTLSKKPNDDYIDNNKPPAGPGD